jgi:hypothetical protein
MRAHRLLVVAILGAPFAIVACSSWEPSRPFEREAPQVHEAIGLLEAGSSASAATTLEDYLSTGACKEGSIGLPESIRRLPNGAFDLGLALFKVGESFGQRFGDEEVDAGQDDTLHQKRAAQIACALEIAQNVASDASALVELRARARYLEGNLDFLGADYEAAVRAYDEAIELSPGAIDAGDPVGRDAAWNRAIALRRIDDQKNKDSGAPDGSNGDSGKPDGGENGDSGKPQPPDGGSPPPNDSGSPSEPDSGGGQKDAGEDANQPPPEPQPQDAGEPPPPKESQDERVLDQFENAPTVQEEDAKHRAQKHRRVRGIEDK